MRKILFAIIILGFFILSASAQQLSFSADQLKKHIMVLASDSLEGRATGTIGQKKAANYIQNEFVKSGLETMPNGSYLHEYNLVRKHKNSILVKSYGHLLFAPWHYHFVSGYNHNDTLNSELVFCGYASHKEIESVNVKDKVIGFLALNPQSAYERIKKLKETHGNHTYFVILPDKNKDLERVWELDYVMSEYNIEDDFNKKYNYRITEEWTKPVDSVNIFYCFSNVLEKVLGYNDNELVRFSNLNEKTNVKWLQSLVNQPLKCYMNYNDSIQSKTVENVGGVVYGKNRNQVIVVTAHYDHLGTEMGDVFYGADDNASGTSVLMELGRMLALDKQNGSELERSVMFLAFSGEEIGLYGSKAYVNNPVFSLDSTILNVNMDMVGRWDKRHENKRDFVYVLNGGVGSSKYFKLAKRKLEYPKGFEVSKKPGAYEKMVFRFGSDHYNFAENNVPYSVIFTGLHDDYHTPNDTPDKINYKNMGNITQLMYQYIYKIADDPKEYPLRHKR